VGPSIENVDKDPHHQPYTDSHPCASPEEHKVRQGSDMFIVGIYIHFGHLSTSKLKGEIVVSDTHPRFISKYVFMRMHITGSIGTNGQMNPAAA
jgi:hypothetical protein